MSHKTASSQAAWALITQGVASARVEAHRLRHLVNRALKLVADSDHSEHLHQVAGDLIMGAPQRLDRMEIDLDRTSWALAKMGDDFLGAKLSLSDKRLVLDAVAPAFGGAQGHMSIESRVGSRWLVANIMSGKLDRSIRGQANKALNSKGFGGSVHFNKIGQALNVAFKVLSEYGIEPDEVLSSDRHRNPSGTWSIQIAFSNPNDSFSPISIRNSVLYFTWTDLGGKYEVVAYLS